MCACVIVAQACPTLCDPMDSPGMNTGVGCHSLLRGIFPTQGSNPGLLHCSQIRYYLSHQRGPPAGGQSEKCTYLSILLLSDFLLETLLEELKEKLENMVTGWCYLHRLASTDPEKSVECVEMKSKGKIKNIPSQ